MRRNAPYDDSPFDQPKSGRALLWLILVIVVAFGAFVAGIGFGRLLSTSEDDVFDDTTTNANSTFTTNSLPALPDDQLEQVPVMPTSTASTTSTDDANASTTSSTVDVMPSTTSTATTTAGTRDIFEPARTGDWLRITATETGFLNVRSTPSPSGALVKKVYPKDEFAYTDEQDGWYKITVDSKTSGWVSGKYIEKIGQ